MRRKFIYLACLLIFIYSVMPVQVLAKDRGKITLIFMDRISWQDIKNAETPALDALMEIGGIGLMTTNTGGSLSQINAYTTIGAGARAVGASNSEMAFKSEKRFQGGSAGEIYKQRTGSAVEPNSIINLSIAQIKRNNTSKQYPVSIGALGTALRNAGFKVAVMGNCDIPKLEVSGYEIKRYLVSTLMDDRGIIPMGEIGQSILVHDSSFPSGIKTNYNKMIDLFDELWHEADVIAVQLGDTSRVEDSKYHVMANLLEDYRRKAIEDGDAMIGKIMEYFQKDRDLIMVITPVGPARELARNNRLTPIIIAGKGFERGFLSSGSTHRAGIVTNLDIGATILKFAGAKKLPGQGGTHIFSTADQGNMVDLVALNERLIEIFNQRSFLLRSYVYIFIFILIGSLLQLILNRKRLYMVEGLLIFAMFIPLVFLLLPLFGQSSVVKNSFAVLFTASLFTILVCRLLSSTRDRIIVICCTTAAALVIDQWSGMNLIQWSPLGYDVISAARFYGIGNEYMGILIGAACTGGAGIIDKIKPGRFVKPNLIVILGWIIVLFTLAAPNIGANVGGTIAAFFAFSISIMLFKGYKVKILNLITIAMGAAILLVGIFILDSFQMVDSQTHMGQTVNLIKQNGIKELFDIFERKISMNIRLFRYTIWTRVFLISLAVIVILFYRPVGIFKEAVNNYPILFKGFIGATVGSAAALAANDSGIVAAATCMIFIAPPIILIIMEMMRKAARGELDYGRSSKISSA